MYMVIRREENPRNSRSNLKTPYWQPKSCRLKYKLSFNFFTEIFSNVTVQNHMMIVISVKLLF